MTHVYIIRHGAAAGYQHGRSTTINPGLSSLGMTQAERLRDRLAATGEIQADVLISSTMQRAKETAEIIAPALGLQVIFDEEFEEIRLGEMEGLTDEEIIAKSGEWRIEDEPFRKIGSSGDSLTSFLMRACGALDRITRTHDGKTIVIVGHGGTLEAAFIYFYNLPWLKGLPMNAHNTSITHWSKTKQFYDPLPQWRLCRFNDHAHLLDGAKRYFAYGL